MSGGGASAPQPQPELTDAATRQAALGEEWLKISKDQFAVSQTRQAELDALNKSISEKQLRLAEEQNAYARTQGDKAISLAEEQLGINRKVAAQQLESAAWQDQIARADRTRYETVYRPIEDQFIDEASNYGSEARQAEAAAAARADVGTAAAVSRNTARREAAAVGIRPDSGRWAGIDRAGELGTALASAGAENSARTAVRDKGLSLKADIANLGRGVSSQALQTAMGANATSGAALNSSAAGTGLGITTLNSAVGQRGTGAAGVSNALSNNLTGAFNANSSFQNSTGIVGAGFGGAQAGVGGAAATLGSLYNQELGIWQNQQQNANNSFNGFMSAVGTGAGLLLSDEDMKTDKEPIEEGEALEAVREMPVESWRYKEGVADEGEHIGTYAQDFKEQTGRGDGHTIPVGDAIGITMKAVQDLAGKVDEIATAVGLGAVRSASGATPAARVARKSSTTRAPASSTLAPTDMAPGLGRRAA